MITAGLLVIGGLAPDVATLVAPKLAEAAARFRIEAPVQQAAFVAQCWIESADFTRAEENLKYVHASAVAGAFSFIKAAEIGALLMAPERLANRAYGGRLGNGPVLPAEQAADSDGWRFRGRGWMQVTGRANYAAAEAGTGLPLVAQPELLAEPFGAAQSAAWFFYAHGCSDMATLGSIDAITRAVNGPGMMRATDRRNLTSKLRDVFTS